MCCRSLSLAGFFSRYFSRSSSASRFLRFPRWSRIRRRIGKRESSIRGKSFLRFCGSRVIRMWIASLQTGYRGVAGQAEQQIRGALSVQTREQGNKLPYQGLFRLTQEMCHWLQIPSCMDADNFA